MNEKGYCKNCGDQIGDDSTSNEFCSAMWSRISTRTQIETGCDLMKLQTV
jgi:hypothetical protein